MSKNEQKLENILANEDAEEVAKVLLGKIICKKSGEVTKKLLITETEMYTGDEKWLRERNFSIEKITFKSLTKTNLCDNCENYSEYPYCSDTNIRGRSWQR